MGGLNIIKSIFIRGDKNNRVREGDVKEAAEVRVIYFPRGPQAKNSSQPLEDGKDKEMDCPQSLQMDHSHIKPC